jgi:hypothetical protein
MEVRKLTAEGSYSNATGVTACQLCAVGKYSDGSEPATALVACSGSCGYSPSTGQSSGTITHDSCYDYSYYEDCRWLISSAGGEISLFFTSFATESGDTVTINRCISASCSSTRKPFSLWNCMIPTVFQSDSHWKNPSSRCLGWRIHESVEDTKLSTNKQHTLSNGFQELP